MEIDQTPDWRSTIKQCPVCARYGCTDCVTLERSVIVEGARDNTVLHDCVDNDCDAGESPAESSSSSSSTIFSGGVGEGERLSAAHAANPQQKIITGQRLECEKKVGLEVATMRSSWASLPSSDDDDDGAGNFPKCYSCLADAVLRCNDCERGGVLLCGSCDETKHDTNTIHSRDDFCVATGGFVPSRHRERVWRLPHCAHCLRAQSDRRPESDSNLLLPPPFRIVYHTTHLGRVNVLIKPRLCTYCQKVFETKASEFDCTPCATGNDWFGNELLDVYVRICEASGFSLSWHSMSEAHAASSAARNEEPFTSNTRQKFTEALKIFAAQRCDCRRLRNLDECLKATLSDPNCPREVKMSLALIAKCAACGRYPLATNLDGSHCIRTLQTAGRSYTNRLNQSVFPNETLDPELGRFRNTQFSTNFRDFRAQERAKVETQRKQSRGITPRDNSCTKVFQAITPLDDTSKKYDMVMAFMSECSHFYISESSNLRIFTKGERLENAHYLMAQLAHNSGQRPLERVFGPVPEVLDPAPAFTFYDLCCKIIAHIRLFDPELADLLMDLTKLEKLHGRNTIYVMVFKVTSMHGAFLLT